MKQLSIFAAVVVSIFLLTGVALAGSTATQTVTFEVVAINEISISGPASLTVIAATPGSQPDEVTNALTTYNITTNETKKITGQLNANMPADVTLKITLQAPAGGTSIEDVSLTNVAKDLVTGITQVAEADRTITYKLSALVTAGVVASDTRTVTLTITNP